ncbi:MAG: GIY-YIG nuclease family protein [Bacteroidota bacterium]
MRKSLDELFHHKAHVYILTNLTNTVLYVGVTSHLPKRVSQHRNGEGSSFARKYRLQKLIYFEGFDRITDALYREKQLKKWRRSWKDRLITNFNPSWEDLGDDVIKWNMET